MKLGGIVLAVPLLLPLVALADCECDPRPLDVVVCLDATGSMGSAIDGVKRRITRLMEVLRENTPRVRVGIVAYRDLGDEFVRRGQPLTEDFPRVEEYLRGIQASGGGDTPEAIEEGLDLSYAKVAMGWDDNAKRVVVLIGDAPPHDDKKARCLDLARQAQKRGIATYAISVDGSVPAMKEIATAGGGRAVDLARAEDIARNILAMALDRDADEWTDLTTTPEDAAKVVQSRVRGTDKEAFTFVQLRYGGDWDPPHAHKRFLRALRERAGVDVALERRVVKAKDADLFREPLLYITGHGELRLDGEEEKRLQEYIARGGTILIERCCDGEAFDKSARSLIARLAPNAPLRECGADHPVFKTGGRIDALDHAKAHGTGEYVKKRPQLFEAAQAGRPLVIYSPTDLGCGWSGFEGGRSCALRESDALRLSVNVILYALGN
jgi:uncharacterized protein YegL